MARTSLQRGEPIMEGKLAPPGTKGGLSAVVTEGKRAMTVRVNDVVGVAGFALPGNYVDIMVNTQEEGANSNANKDQTISKIVLERILVLAVAQEVEPRRNQAQGGQRRHAGSDAGPGRKARPGAQRRHPVAGAAQPDRSQAGQHRRRDQGHACWTSSVPPRAGKPSRKPRPPARAQRVPPVAAAALRKSKCIKGLDRSTQQF